MERAVARWVFEHLFLPPNLPHTDHGELGAEYLLRELAKAASEYANNLCLITTEGCFWQQLSDSILKWAEIYGGGEPCNSRLIGALQDMRETGM